MLAPLRAYKLATELDLDVDLLPICHMCLFDVGVTVDTGDERKISGAVTRLTADLWAEGLEAPARAALEDACRRGVRDAERALAELDATGAKAPIARAIVRRLAWDTAIRMRARHAAFTN